MAAKGQAINVQYYAYNTSTGAYTTGDSANHTLRWVKDGSAAAPTNAASEIDATNTPGLYNVLLTSTEATCNEGMIAGKSSTSNVILIGIAYTFENEPTAAPGASGGLLISGTNTGTVTLGALTCTGSFTISDGLLVSRSSSNASAITAT